MLYRLYLIIRRVIELEEKCFVSHLILQVLGLDICADTMVGDQMIRGISGGQRKRVTTGKFRSLVDDRGGNFDPFTYK